MRIKKENAAIAGVGAAACAACCAGPILGFLAAIGLGSAGGAAMFGTIAIVVGIAGGAIVIIRRRRRAAARSCAVTPSADPVPVALSNGPRQP